MTGIGIGTGPTNDDSEFPEIAHLADHVYFVNGSRRPAHHLYPVLEVGLLHRLALGNQRTVGQVAVHL